MDQILHMVVHKTSLGDRQCAWVAKLIGKAYDGLEHVHKLFTRV